MSTVGEPVRQRDELACRTNRNHVDHVRVCRTSIGARTKVHDPTKVSKCADNAFGETFSDGIESHDFPICASHGVCSIAPINAEGHKLPHKADLIVRMQNADGMRREGAHG
jgi:hypothetical protein